MAKKKKVKLIEYQYVNSLINNPVMDYRVYVMNSMEKIMISIALIVIGGLVGLVFYGGLFKRDGDATLATYISDLIFL